MLPPFSADTKKVIVAPLNWGLGHATRSVPIIRLLVSEGKEVIIASDGEALQLLQEEFPKLAYESLPAYNVSYKGDSLLSIVLSNIPNIVAAIVRERSAAKKLYNKYQPDLIISDSRFGFRIRQVKSIIISHQLNLLSKSKVFHFLLNLVNGFFLNSFDEVWVPDDVAHTWSGELSKSDKIKKSIFIGPLSRLSKDVEIGDREQRFDVCIILSGPEPARSRFEEELIEFLISKTSNSSQAFPNLKGARERKICLVRGTTKKTKLNLPHNWTVIERAGSKEINKLLLTSNNIISRSGYTSIMDYAAMGIGAHLIPTPGQSEQEYLAEWLDGKCGMKKLKI